MKHKLLFFLALAAMVVVLASWPDAASAQCAMCKASAESNLRAGGGDPAGLNKGILYMLAMPYLLVGTIAFLWIRNRRKAAQQLVDIQPEELN